MIKTLIVDDEPLARELLVSYLEKMPAFILSGTCQNALEAFAVLSKEDIGLVLLDINMPEITGMELLRSLKNPPKIIFTTAYAEYALQGYEVDAVDYLLKPITFERFAKALNKLSDSRVMGKLADVVPQGVEKILFVKSEGKMVRIDLEELWLVEGFKNYIRLRVTDRKIIVHGTMQKIEDELKRYPCFIRINKSFIVNLNYISEVEVNCIRIKNESLVIGNTYRQEVHSLLQQYKLL